MGLEAEDLGAEPLAALGRWLDDAIKAADRPNPNAMTLCTVGPDGGPQGRVVLLKAIDDRGLRFFTNSRSEKGRALAIQPRAEAVFHWDGLGRQVRVRGPVEILGAEETRDYFLSRPRGSQLAAWASSQSEPVEDRVHMDARLAEMEARFQGREVEPPPHWWGYRLVPECMEFWQEGAFRFHDRFVYVKSGSAWKVGRLFP